jgi:hypothetical protein
MQSVSIALYWRSKNSWQLLMFRLVLNLSYLISVVEVVNYLETTTSGNLKYILQIHTMYTCRDKSATISDKRMMVVEH